MKTLTYLALVFNFLSVVYQSSFPINGPEMYHQKSHLDLEDLVKEYLSALNEKQDLSNFQRDKKKSESEIEPLLNHRRKTNPDEQACKSQMDSFESNRMIDSKTSIANGAKFLRVEKIGLNSDLSLKDLQDSCVDLCCSTDSCDTGLLSLIQGENGYRCYLFKCSGHCIFIKHKDYIVLRGKSPEQGSDSDIQTGHKNHMDSESYKNMVGGDSKNGANRLNFDDGENKVSTSSDHAQAVIILIIGCLIVLSFFVYIALSTKYLSKKLRIMSLLKMDTKKAQNSQNVDADGDYLINGLYL